MRLSLGSFLVVAVILAFAMTRATSPPTIADMRTIDSTQTTADQDTNTFGATAITAIADSAYMAEILSGLDAEDPHNKASPRVACDSACEAGIVAILGKRPFAYSNSKNGMTATARNMNQQIAMRSTRQVYSGVATRMTS